MTDHTDLIARLRGMSRYAHDDKSIGDEAADALSTLSEANKRLEHMRQTLMPALQAELAILREVGDALATQPHRMELCEAHRNHAEREYFAARTAKDNAMSRRAFCDGFDRGWCAARGNDAAMRLAAPEDRYW